MNDDRSKNNLSKLSIYTKQFVVSSIYLINRAHKKQVLSVYSSHYVSIYFWIWWLQTMKSFSKLYTIFYTMLKTKVSHLSLKRYTWTKDPFLAFHSGNWFMADSPLSCLFIKSFGSLFEMWFFIYPIHFTFVRSNWQFQPVCGGTDQIALPTKSRRLNWTASAKLTQYSGGCSICCCQP